MSSNSLIKSRIYISPNHKLFHKKALKSHHSTFLPHKPSHYSLSTFKLLVRPQNKAPGDTPNTNSDKPYQELTSSQGEWDLICSVDETSSQEFEANYQPKTDFLKALAVLAAASTGAIAINHSWVAANQDVAMAIVFGIGYAGIIFEESLAFNKSEVGLLVAVSLWVIRSIGNSWRCCSHSSKCRWCMDFNRGRDNYYAVDTWSNIYCGNNEALTGLPPYMGMLLGLGVLWIVTDAIHYGEPERQRLKVPQTLSRIDTQGALFFLGILLSVSSLESAGILRELANYLDAHIPNTGLIASAIGVVSAIIDNVPLVAATMGMYDLTSFPQDSEFWQLIAFCAGTGESMLVIGSAAGIAFMGMEKVSGFAFAGYAAGIFTYLAAHNLHLSLPTTVAQVPFLSSS